MACNQRVIKTDLKRSTQNALPPRLLVQLKRGMAWHYKAYQCEQSLDDRLAYAAAEK
jgi:hypothetical protein